MKLQRKLLIATSFLAVISFNAVADSKTKCSNATLKGTYSWNSQTSLSASAGMESFDGAGGVVTKETNNGNPIVNTTTGSYTVNEDCTGTYAEGDETDALFINPNGDSFSWVETDQSTDDNISSGTETRISKALLVK